jgi:hypothetical protein
MGKILFILAVLVLLVMVVTVALLKMLGAKGLVLAFILVLIAIWGGIKVIGKVFKALLVSPFKAKGQVLRDATVKESKTMTRAASAISPRSTGTHSTSRSRRAKPAIVHRFRAGMQTNSR